MKGRTINASQQTLIDIFFDMSVFVAGERLTEVKYPHSQTFRNALVKNWRWDQQRRRMSSGGPRLGLRFLSSARSFNRIRTAGGLVWSPAACRCSTIAPNHGPAAHHSQFQTRRKACEFLPDLVHLHTSNAIRRKPGY